MDKSVEKRWIMTEKELMQKNVEEFERLQDYMISCEKDSELLLTMRQCQAILQKPS